MSDSNTTRPRDVSYEFGSFRLDVAERLLLRQGESVSLAPKVFDTLVVLVENSGRLMDKDELMSSAIKIWSGVSGSMAETDTSGTL